MQQKDLNKLVIKIYNIFDCWTDLGAEGEEASHLRNQLRKLVTKAVEEESKLAFKAGSAIKSWSDSGVEPEFESYQDWCTRRFLK